MTFLVLDQQCARKLERPFEGDEIAKVIYGMANDEAPGSNGFTMGFFQAFWEVISCDLTGVFKVFMIMLV